MLLDTKIPAEADAEMGRVQRFKIDAGSIVADGAGDFVKYEELVRAESALLASDNKVFELQYEVQELMNQLDIAKGQI